jgi:hypothetical protein
MDTIRFFIFLLQGGSVIAGFYYINKKAESGANKFLTYFLLFTFCIEAIGFIPRIIYSQEYLHYLKETVWFTNFWLYNPYLIVSYTFYAFYFSINLKIKGLRQVLNYLVTIFVISSLANLVFSNIFFVSYSMFTMFAGIALLFLAISFYYYELLQDEKLLYINKSVQFYISVAFLLFNLISMPLWINIRFYNNTLSPEFINLYRIIFLTANILLYSTYTFAFIYCAQVKQLPALTKKHSTQ